MFDLCVTIKALIFSHVNSPFCLMEGELQGFGVCFVCIDGSYNKKVVHQDKTFISVTSTLA